MAHESARSERDGWMDDNTRGLSLAALAEWDEAAEAFAAAADVLARRAPDASSHDALALILGNLAQACFRAGRTDDALLHAQRACALRVALTGEDAMPVARERMDLAVMLGATGRLDEAQALAQRAIAAVELHAGDEDARLVVMLENAARLALAAGAPANAEPLLLRLHGLLDLYGMSTDRADRLLAMVAAVRARAEAPRADEHRAEVAVYPHVSIDDNAAEEDWDDQPLRDAVALTDVLLRTTPSGVIAILEPANRDAESLAAFETVVDTSVEPMLELVDVRPTARVDIALDLADDLDLLMPDASTDLMGIELDDALADSLIDVPTHRPTLEREPAPPSRVEEPAPVVPEPIVPEPLTALNAPLRQPVRHLEPPLAHSFGPPPAALVTPGAWSEPAPPPPPMPTERDMTRAQDAQHAADADASSAQAASRAVRTGRPPMSDRHRKEEGGSRVGLIVAGVGAAVAAGGAAWYFLLR